MIEELYAAKVVLQTSLVSIGPWARHVNYDLEDPVEHKTMNHVWAKQFDLPNTALPLSVAIAWTYCDRCGLFLWDRLLRYSGIWT
jgi:hypothetical protein